MNNRFVISDVLEDEYVCEGLDEEDQVFVAKSELPDLSYGNIITFDTDSHKWIKLK